MLALFPLLAVLASTSLTNAQTFSNPIFWEDLADLDVLRVNDTYYYSASTMHYSPGAPILRSFDLVNWEFIGHSVPKLDFSSKYDLTNGQNAYVKGVWASSLRFRPSNGLWYWAGCIEFSTSYVFTSPAPEGPWKKSSTINNCWYDCGILIDDDDTMYVAYGNTQISVAQLSADGLSQVKTQVVFNAPSNIGALEGNRFYKVNGKYYILTDHPATAEYVLQASNPFGPYTIKALVDTITSPVSGSGNPHQGGIVDTPSGDWYYMAFIDNYPGGRVPVLAPITWGSDGFPVIQSVNGAWGKSYPYPAAQHTLSPPMGTDSFAGSSLGPQWEWNHNPDTTKFTVNNGLTLHTATLTTNADLYAARNTLCHRLFGPTSTGTIELDYTNMLSGDRAGLALLRDYSAYIAVINSNGSFRVSMVQGLAMGVTWNTISTGTEAASSTLSSSSKKVWLRATADIHPGPNQQAHFSYSTDGNTFKQLGGSYTLNNTWEFFMGYRFGVFNFATQALGGSVGVSEFVMGT
jgi:beta-xylosidase